MWRCKHVSEALHQQDYKTLPRLKRWGLRLHVMLCFVCRRYQKQVIMMQDTCRHYREEVPCCSHSHDKLPADKRTAMQNKLTEAMCEKKSEQ